MSGGPHRIAERDAWPPLNAWWSKGQRKLAEDGGVVVNLAVALTHRERSLKEDLVGANFLLEKNGEWFYTSYMYLDWVECKCCLQ